MSDVNPYQSPSPGRLQSSDEPALGELVRAWEKLRLTYNAVMLGPGIAILVLWITKANLPVPVAIFFGILTGIGANAAFFLGPLAELYLRGLFRQGTPLGKGRILIFSAGLVVSGGVMLMAAILAFHARL